MPKGWRIWLCGGICALAVLCPLGSVEVPAQSASQKVLQLYRSGSYAEAIKLARENVAEAERSFGPDHPSVANALGVLAVLYEGEDRYAEAEPLARRALGIWERAKGPGDWLVGASLVDLARIHRARGRYGEAEQTYKRALAILEKALSPRHQEVATPLVSLAELYKDQGRYAEAEPHLKRALAILENLLAPSQKELAVPLNGLAGLYAEQGRYAEAEPLYKRAVSILEKALGPDDPGVAASLSGLAGLYKDQGRFADAESLYRRTLIAAEKVLGPNHPEFATRLNNFAGLFVAQGRYIDAEPLYKRTVSILEKALGPDSPRVAAALGNLARVYGDLGRYAEAEQLYTRVVAIEEKSLGPDHPDVLWTLNNLAWLYDAQQRSADAEQLFKRILAGMRKVFGPDHLDVAGALGDLAQFYRLHDRYNEAEPLAKQSLAIREKVLGPDHPRTERSLDTLAEIYRAQDRFAAAEPLYKRSLAIVEKHLGADHPNYVVRLVGLAQLYASQGRLEEAAALVWRVKQSPKTDVRELTILFGTNRLPDSGAKTLTFGGERARHMSFGMSVLLGAREQVVARAERRAAGAGLLDRSPAKLTSEQRFAIQRTALSESMGQLVKGLPAVSPHALIFVHGYNVGFEDALKRTAQIAFDLDFSGTCLLFTWPSKAKLLEYAYDRESAGLAARYLIEFLEAAAKAMPKTKLHLIAHSMGNVVVLNALEKIAQRSASQTRLPLGEVILAHPDVAVDDFKQVARWTGQLRVGMTLYTSRDDRALWLSRGLHGGGRAGGVPVIAAGVDTIDITGLGASLWSANHTVYAANPAVFGDIARLMASSDRPVDKRTRDFERVATEQGSYWRYRMTVTAQK